MGKGVGEHFDSRGLRHLPHMFICPNFTEIFVCLLIPVITFKIRWMKSRTEFPLLYLRLLSSLVLIIYIGFIKFILIQGSRVSDSSPHSYSTRLWPKSWPVFLHHSQHPGNGRRDGCKAWHCCRCVPVDRYTPSLLSLGFTPGNWQKEKNKTLLIYPFQWGQHYLSPCHLAVLVLWHAVPDCV